MRTGRVVKRSLAEPHLDRDAWVEVFPKPTAEDVALLSRLDPADRTYRAEPHLASGPSPLLVRRSVWAELRKTMDAAGG